MIGRWLIKLVIGLVVFAFIAFEVGSPLVTRAILDGQVHDAANDAAHDYLHNHSVDSAQAVAQQDADNDGGGVKLEGFSVDDQGTVHVTLSKQAKSYVLHNFQPTKNWYNVRVSASAVPK